MDTPSKRFSRSPRAERRTSKNKKKHLRSTTTETDGSDEDSLESEQTDSQESRSNKHGVNGVKKGGHDWEIMDGLKAGQKCETKPEKYSGYLTKKRKWPMKGWHKRYFMLDKGIFTYAKSSNDIDKGKYHGSVDVGLSFVTYKRDGRRIDIDAEDLIYHLKAKSTQQFDEWIRKLRHHRLYRQHEMAYGTRDAPRLVDVTSPVDDLTPITSPVVTPVLPLPNADAVRIARGSFKLSSLERSTSKVANWLIDTAGMDQCNKDMNAAQSKIYELGTLLEKLYSTARSPHPGNLAETHEYPDLSNSLDRKEKKRWALKRGRKDSKKSLSTEASTGSSVSSPRKSTPLLTPVRRLRRWLSSSSTSIDLKIPEAAPSIHTSSSNPNLLTNHEAERMRPTSMPEHWLTGAGAGASFTGEGATQNDMKVRQDFLGVAKSVHDTLKSLSKAIVTERERLKHAVEQEQDAKNQTLTPNAAYVQSLRAALAESVKQNAELRTKLNKINEIANLSTVPISPIEDVQHPLLLNAPSFDGQSVSEFYDAAETLISSQETSDEEEDEVSSDVSDTEYTAITSTDEGLDMKHLRSSRRSRLPAPRPDTGDFSLWGLLRKNIGKDLSKISMPVSLNEPLSMLQRLCEDLEYSDLLDRAAETEDPYDRMVLIAAFSVSPYASTYYRVGQKPFNPLLGETYECIREDRGWRFIAEQVSHHPPISACYCDSKNFIFSQDIRIKTKFWGKSMEVQPVGEVSVSLPRWKDRYTWNKATTCIHNILGGTRWVDHYGECTIKNHSSGITCKLKYAKSSYWSEERHEVYGTVVSADGKVMRHISGKCNEGIYCGHAQSAKCIWRPGAMPEEHELYYGFTKFAMELNEIDREQVHLYAPTDTRFRPDQRALEEGRIQDAENEKNRLEQSQRERRKQREEERVTYSPKWFMKDEDQSRDSFKYTGKYWELRKDPGFIKMAFSKLW